MRTLVILIVGILIGAFSMQVLQRAVPLEQTAAVGTTANAHEESAKTESTREARTTYRVLKVVDGDTVALEMDGTSVTVRLIGLDTPETVDPRTSVQCFGVEASNKAKELLTGARVAFESDPSQDTYDKYGRTLGYIYLADPSTPLGAGSTLFNEYMIAEGYAYEYTYERPYRYQARFKAAQEQARVAKKGLWADDACAPGEPQKKVPRAGAAPAAPALTNGTYQCSTNTYNCSSFKTHAEAQATFDSCGGNTNDVHKLDSDKDGVVCESLP